MTHAELKNLTNKWIFLFTQVHGKASYIALAFYFASVYRDVIFRKHHYFPLLFINGKAGTGKSTLAKNLINIARQFQKPFIIKTNVFEAFINHAVQDFNSIVWYDEYHPLISEQRNHALKSFYEGTAYYSHTSIFKAQKENAIPVQNAAVIISGQTLPADNGLMQRLVLIETPEQQFSEDQTDDLLRLIHFQARYGAVIHHFLAEQSASFDRLFKIDTTTLENKMVSEKLMINYLILARTMAVMDTLIGDELFPIRESEQEIHNAINNHLTFL